MQRQERPWRDGLYCEDKTCAALAGLGWGSLTSISKRVLRSTSVPTPLALSLPLIKSPSQWPGNCLSSTSGGRTWILKRSAIWPRRSFPRERGQRLAQAGDELAAQLPSRLGIDDVIDGFVRGAFGSLMRVQFSQMCGNFLGRPKRRRRSQRFWSHRQM